MRLSFADKVAAQLTAISTVSTSVVTDVNYETGHIAYLPEIRGKTFKHSVHHCIDGKVTDAVIHDHGDSRRGVNRRKRRVWHQRQAHMNSIKTAAEGIVADGVRQTPEQIGRGIDSTVKGC